MHPSKLFFSELGSKLSSSSQILTEPASVDFETALERWSNYDKKTPAAIVRAANEEDIVTTVREAVRHAVPFVPASGGHSPWSTIGDEGIVIDLGLYKGVDIDAAQNVALVKGGTLMKELQTALHPHKQFACVGNGNTVGVIPYTLGGGINIYGPLVGYGSENIVSARLVTAKGEVIIVSNEQNHDLLWALRGAGQFFGLVTELTIRTYPYSLMGNEDGIRQLGSYVFLPHQADAVCEALEKIMEDKSHVSAGHFMAVAAPPDFKQQILLVAPQIFAPSAQAQKLLKPLIDIGPIMQTLGPSLFETHSDHLAFVCAPGDFKRFSQMGLSGFDRDNFKKMIDLHANLLAECPDAARSGYTVEWHTGPERTREYDSAFGHEHVDYWLNVLSWYSDPKHHAFVQEMDQKCQAQMRVGTEQQAFVSYTNSTREDPVEYRYKGADRIARLRALKKQWDPTGVFTKELL